MLRRVALSVLAFVLLLLAAARRRRSRRSAKRERARGRRGASACRSPARFSVDGRPLAVTGRPLRIEGRIVPYVPGQTVSVRIWRGHKLLKRGDASRRSRRARDAPRRSASGSTRRRSGDVQIFARARENGRAAQAARESGRCRSSRRRPAPARAARSSRCCSSGSRRSATRRRRAASTTPAPSAPCSPSARSTGCRASRR